MIDSAQNALSALRNRIAAACARVGRDASEVSLIAASKTVDATRLQDFFAAGLKDAGENYVQEGVAKIEILGRDAARWHCIGALQRNKARAAVQNFDIIHSVDRLSLARALNEAAANIGKIQSVLIQVNIGDQSSKAGCAPHELEDLWRACSELPHLSLRGLMTLPPAQTNAEASRPYFRRLRELSESLQIASQSTAEKPAMELSMGMSQDFEIAVEEGATMVRVGTALFGTRNFSRELQK